MIARLKRLILALTYYIYNNFITHVPSYWVRHWYLRRILRIQIGRRTAVHMGCFFTAKHVTIGNNCVINRHCYIDGRGGIQIGDNVSISPQAYLVSLTHDPQDSAFAVIPRMVRIEDCVWIGVRAIVLPGVVLGQGCVVGAGAVVTKNVEPYVIVAGVPARKIGERTRTLDYMLSYFPFFDTDVLSS